MIKPTGNEKIQQKKGTRLKVIFSDIVRIYFVHNRNSLVSGTNISNAILDLMLNVEIP